jgi:hypothetical protein
MCDKYSSSAFSPISFIFPNFEIRIITTQGKLPKFSFSHIQKDKRSELKAQHQYLSVYWRQKKVKNRRPKRRFYLLGGEQLRMLGCRSGHQGAALRTGRRRLPPPPATCHILPADSKKEVFNNTGVTAVIHAEYLPGRRFVSHLAAYKFAKFPSSLTYSKQNSPKWSTNAVWQIHLLNVLQINRKNLARQSRKQISV